MAKKKVEKEPVSNESKKIGDTVTVKTDKGKFLVSRAHYEANKTRLTLV